MNKKQKIKAPFFEIGPKGIIYGKELVAIAKAADAASRKYDVRIIFTPQPAEIYPVAQAVTDLLVFAQHIDPLPVGRGLGSILAESVKAAGAVGAMLNHAEKPLTLNNLKKAIDRAKSVDLMTIVCADSIAEARAVAMLSPDIIVAEPTELIGTGKASDMSYVRASTMAIKEINPDIQVLQGAGISNGQDVYDVIFAGADATGSTSGILLAKDPFAMLEEMISAVRMAYNDRQGQ